MWCNAFLNSEFAKILIAKLDFRELDFKLQKSKVIDSEALREEL